MSDKKELVAKDGRKLVAIYDSLKTNFPSHWIVKQLDAIYVTSGVTSARMFSLGQYPYCIEMKDASDMVYVDVFDVSEGAFDVISAYYCHPFTEYLASVHCSMDAERVVARVSMFMLQSCIGGVKVVPGMWTPEMALSK